MEASLSNANLTKAIILNEMLAPKIISFDNQTV